MSPSSRTFRGMGLALALAAPLALVASAGPIGRTPALAQTLDDLDDAEDTVAEVAEDLDAVTGEYEAVWADIERIRSEVVGLEQQAEELQATAEDATERLGDRARSAYKRGATATVQTLLTSDGPQETVERAGLLAALQLRERVGVEQALASRAALGQTLGLIADRQDELEVLQVDLDRTAAVLQTQLEAARADADEIRSLVARQRRVDRGDQQGIYSCIFDPGGFRFRDTWGAPRSGGRSHKGTDVFASYGAPVYAITSGVIERHSSSPLGGIGLYLRGDDRNRYYYAHLDSIDAAGRVGNRVTAGELVARNGSSGNADRSAPHVHFELRPGGGATVNPYPWLAASCL